jgi:hypothetical protein
MGIAVFIVCHEDLSKNSLTVETVLSTVFAPKGALSSGFNFGNRAPDKHHFAAWRGESSGDSGNSGNFGNSQSFK